jgi:undecaprenyl-phosphate 4-deoxy-4-formamido-L-arabinose transferase
MGMNAGPTTKVFGARTVQESVSRRVSVVIPVYRSETILPELVRGLESVLAEIADNFELILINDSSPDRSWDVIGDLARQYSWIRPINLMRNYGQHNSLLCGIRAARYDVIVTMDDDLQHPPEEIPKLLDVLAGEYDVVYGTPEQEQHGFGRDLASWVTKLALQNVMGAGIARQVCAFRAFRAEVAKAFEHYEGSFVSSTMFPSILLRQAKDSLLVLQTVQSRKISANDCCGCPSTMTSAKASRTRSLRR